MKFRLPVVLVHLLFLFLLNTKISSQTVLLNENFENQFPANGWSVRSYTPLGNDWVKNSTGYFNGSYSAVAFPNVNNANSWLFSSPVQFTAGEIYVLKYFVNLQAAASLNVSLKEYPDYASNAIFLHNAANGLTGNLTLVTDTFTAETTGIKYLAFLNNSAGRDYCGTTIDDVSLTELSQLPDCTVPTAGLLSSPQSISCVGKSITLNLTNIDQNSINIRYAWQTSIDGINWINLTNGYTLKRQLNLIHPGTRYYRHTDTCLSSGAVAFSNIIQIQSTPFQNCFCTPSGMNCFSLSLTNVTIPGSTINNNSGCTTGGYTNYSNSGTATVYKGHTIPLQISINNSLPINYSVGLWVDLNQNGQFEENEFSSKNNLTATLNAVNYYIPNSATTGETRLRIKIKYYTNNQAITWDEACSENALSGETEDYKILIAEATNCTGPISAGTLTAPTQICPNNNFLISANGATSNQNQMRYSWQISPDNVNWTNITNTSYIINPIQISQNNTSFYRLVDTCLATGQTAVSAPVQVVNTDILNCYCVPAASVCSDYRIDSVSIGTIQYGNTNCSSSGYVNNFNLSTSHSNGSLLPFYIKVKPNLLSTYVWILIDFNRNGSFENNEKIYSGITQSSPLTGTVVIPFSVPAGEMAIRIMANNSGFFNSSCTTGGTGETEDYKLIVNQSNPITTKFSWHVKQNALSGNNGLNWANAFNSLQTALNISQPGDTIKVAKGIYNPGTTNTQYFTLKDSVLLLGGYPDSGNPGNNDRDIGVFQSVLSGEIGTSIQTDNTRLILNISGIKGVVVDGFIIEKGYESSSGNEGPVIISNSNATISRCVIRNNINGKNAAGFNVLNSNLLSINNIFENNYSGGFDSTAAVISSKLNSSVELINNVIAKNRSKFILNLSDSRMKLYSSTIFKNTGYNLVHDSSSLEIRNSIFYFNGSGYITDTSSFYKDVYSNLVITNTITENFFIPGSFLFNTAPKFKDTSRVAGQDNVYFSADDGLNLINPCSPAINAGANEYCTQYNFDIKNQARVKNGTTDLGAYEVQEGLNQQSTVLYVNKTATGLNNGTSWQNAYTDLQTAFNACSDTIKVAAGVYPVSLTDETAYYQLTNRRVIIGGYPNTGNPDNSTWNPALNVTAIDGTVSASIKTPLLLVAANNDSTSRFIGFTLKNNAPFSIETGLNQASFKITHTSSPYIQQVTFDASLTYSVNLVTIQAFSKPVFKKCSFYNTVTNPYFTEDNRSINITTGSNPEFMNCYFGKDTTSNTNGITGSPVKIKSAYATFDSCTFNRAVNDALTLNNAEVLVQHTTFKLTKGRSIYSVSSIPFFKSCLFIDSTKEVSTPGGISVLEANTNAFFENCEFKHAFTFVNGSVTTVDRSTVTYNSCYFNGPNYFTENSVIVNKAGTVYINNSVLFMKHKNQYGARIRSAVFAENTEQGVLEIRNSTLAGHTYLQKPMILSTTGANVKFYNSIIWRYSSTSPNTYLINDIITSNNNDVNLCDIRNSILFKQLGTTLTNSTIGINPRLTDLSNPEGPDKKMYTADDGFIPCSCSPAVNSGLNSLNFKPFDILNNNRIINGNIDRGAYEITSPVTDNKVFYVKPGPDGGNGLSWATAYNNPQKAILNTCADTIKVAKGVYKPAQQNRDSSFAIYNGIVLLGGYPDSGNPTDQDRNPLLFPTELSGDIGIPNDSLDNTYSVMKISCPDTTVIVDGFIIRQGNADGTGSNPNGGGGIMAEGNRKLFIKNCTVKNNYATNGGGLAVVNSNIFIDKSIFDNNKSPNYGGGFFIQDFYAFIDGQQILSETRFTNSIISNNKGLGGLIFGASVAGTNANISFKNTIFYKNEAEYGAGLKISDHAIVDIINCSFISNNTLSNTSGIGLLYSNMYISSVLGARVINSIFKNNTFLGQPTSIINNDFNWSNGTNTYETIPWYNLQYSAFSSSQTSSGPGNIPESWVPLRNIDLGPGADNIWRNQDDGLQVTDCSYSIDHGENTVVDGLNKDITDSVRIRNNKVDLGPYEKETFKATIHISDSLICIGESVTCTATVTNASPSAVFIWTVNGIPVGTNSPVFTSTTLLNSDKIQLKVKNQNCSQFDTAYSNIITIQAGTALVPVATITATDTVTCANQSITFTASVTRSNFNTVYQWKVNGFNVGTNSPVFTSSTITNGAIVSVDVTVNGTCLSVQTVTSNFITIQVRPIVTPQVTITGSPNPSCVGSPVQFIANSTNPGNTPSYQWLVNGINRGSDNPVFTTAVLDNNDLVSVRLTSSENCTSSPVAQSNLIQVQRTAQLTPSINITASPMTCPGNIVTLTANMVNGGSAPQIVWRKNGTATGITGNIYSSTQLNQGDIIDAVLTSNESCINQGTINSNAITINYSSLLIPSLTISTSQTSICAGTPVTFNAIPVNGGTTPVIKWYINGSFTGFSGTTYTNNALTNSDQVKAQLISSSACVSNPIAESNIITMQVSPTVNPTVSITANQTSICAGTTVIFTATPVNGGNAPTYQWFVNSTNTGQTGSVFSSNSLNNSDQVKVILTSSSSCVTNPTATSNIISVQVTSPVIPVVTFTATQTSICPGTSVTFTATPTNGGTNPAYQWQINGNNAGTNNASFTTNTLIHNDQVKVIMTSNASCINPSTVSSNVLTMQVSSVITPSVTITTDQNAVCAGTQVTLTATPVNGGSAPIYQWQVNGTISGANNTSFVTSTLNNGDQVRVLMTSNAACANPVQVASNTISFNVTNITIPIISISGTTSVTAGQLTSLVSTITNGGSAPVYTWQDSTAAHNWQNIAGGSTNNINYTAVTTGDKVRCLLTSNASCPSPAQVTSNWLQFVVSPITGLNPVNGSGYGIRMYPNPVESIVYIDSLKSIDKWNTLRVVSLNGAGALPDILISNRNTVAINVQALPSGLYLIILNRKQGKPAFMRFIKQ